MKPVKEVPHQTAEGDNAKNLLSSENVAIALYAPESIDQGADVSWSTMEISANKRNLINSFKGETGFGQAFEELVQSGLTSLANSTTGGISNFMENKKKSSTAVIRHYWSTAQAQRVPAHCSSVT